MGDEVYGDDFLGWNPFKAAAGVIKQAVRTVNPFDKRSVIRATLRAVDVTSKSSLKDRFKDVAKSAAIVDPFSKDSLFRKTMRGIDFTNKKSAIRESLKYVDPTQTGAGFGRFVGLGLMGVATGGLGLLAAGAKGVYGDVKNAKRRKAAAQAVAAEEQQQAIAEANPATAQESSAAQPEIPVEQPRIIGSEDWRYMQPSGDRTIGYNASLDYQNQQQPVVASAETEAIAAAAEAAKPVTTQKSSPLIPLAIAGAVAGYFILNHK